MFKAAGQGLPLQLTGGDFHIVARLFQKYPQDNELWRALLPSGPARGEAPLDVSDDVFVITHYSDSSTRPALQIIIALLPMTIHQLEKMRAVLHCIMGAVSDVKILDVTKDTAYQRAHFRVSSQLSVRLAAPAVLADLEKMLATEPDAETQNAYDVLKQVDEYNSAVAHHLVSALDAQYGGEE